MEKLKVLMLGPPRLSLAAAESVTCGRVQAMIGAISGASEFFLGGVTAYTLEQKAGLLGVDQVAAEKVNCVSAEVAEQMAKGVCRMFGAEVGVATTGYAEASKERAVAAPFGWWALARRRGDGSFAVRSGRIDCPGSGRVAAQERIAQAAVAALVGWLGEG
jgi:nicotinamide-nucleotide amidase